MSAPYRKSRATWRGIALTIRHSPQWIRIPCGAVQHVEVESDGHVPIPITETGYCSHFMIGDQALADYGADPVAFVLAWLDHEAKGRAWRAFEAQQRQDEAASRQMLLI